MTGISAKDVYKELRRRVNSGDYSEDMEAKYASAAALYETDQDTFDWCMDDADTSVWDEVLLSGHITDEVTTAQMESYIEAVLDNN